MVVEQLDEPLPSVSVVLEITHPVQNGFTPVRFPFPRPVWSGRDTMTRHLLLVRSVKPIFRDAHDGMQFSTKLECHIDNSAQPFIREQASAP